MVERQVVRNAKGEPFSKWKPDAKFAYVWEQEGLETRPETELMFCVDRKFRFDFAWSACRVGVEIDGFGYGHQAQQQMAADNEKANLAIELGWKVLRYNSRQLGSRQGVSDAVEQVCRVLCGVKVE